MKHLLSILFLYFQLNGYTQDKQKIKFLAMELHSDFYKEASYPKDGFKNYVDSDSLFFEFPKTIRSFEFAPDKSLITFCKECDLKVANLKDGLDKKEAPDYLEKNLTICYAKYIQTSPELRFAFELQNGNDIYHINEVSVYIYSTRMAHGIDKNYFAHKKDEREKLFIDIHKIKQHQKIKLNQTHAVKDGGLALNLRFFPSDHWNGSFEKVKVLMHIDFIFTNGQIINSKPFMIEM